MGTSTTEDANKVTETKEDTRDMTKRRPWFDEHGCCRDCGYSWCASKAKCLKIWMEDCPGGTTRILHLPAEIQEQQHRRALGSVDSGSLFGTIMGNNDFVPNYGPPTIEHMSGVSWR
jgi:hypothetical protein